MFISVVAFVIHTHLYMTILVQEHRLPRGLAPFIPSLLDACHPHVLLILLFKYPYTSGMWTKPPTTDSETDGKEACKELVLIRDLQHQTNIYTFLHSARFVVNLNVNTYKSVNKSCSNTHWITPIPHLILSGC